MNEHPLSSLASALTRRRFLHGSALGGAAVAMSGPALAQDATPTTVPSGATLIRPAAPADSSLPPLAPPDKQPPNLEVPKPERKLGWAIVGLGELSLGEILPAFGAAKKSRPVALVSGHADKAKQIAQVYNIDPAAIYNYQDYDRIADDPAIDVVYIVLPNSMHAEYTIRALKAGKHVLCEKPMASTIAECEQMIAAAETAQRKLGVAYRLHYEPLNLAAAQMCRDKKFGTVKTFTSSNCQNVEPPNIRLSGPLGGGPVGDVGVYCINAARYTIGEEPSEAIAVQAQPKSDPRFREVPETVSFLLRYPSGVVATCECSFGTGRSSSYQVLCEKGSINMDPAFSYAGLKLWTEESKDDVPIKTDLLIPQVDQFASEMDGFSASILENKPVPTPGDMGLRDMRIVLAIMESARLGGQPVKIGQP